MRSICLPVFALTTALASAAEPARSSLADSEKQLLEKGHRHEKHGWIYVHFEGEPKTRGFQHGYLLYKEIAESIRVRKTLWEYESATDWKWLVEKASAMLGPRIDPENLAELDGIVAGLKAAGVNSSREELIAHNAYFELAWYWWPPQKKKMDGP